MMRVQFRAEQRLVMMDSVAMAVGLPLVCPADLEYTRIEHAGGTFVNGNAMVGKSDEGALTLRGIKDPAGAQRSVTCSGA